MNPYSSVPFSYGMIGNTTTTSKALVLTGGGIDSFVSALAYQRLAGENTKIDFVFIDYGQANAKVELYMAREQARSFGGDLFIEKLNLGNTAMKASSREAMKEEHKVAGTDYSKNDDYVPHRNANFILKASATAEELGHDTIVIGAVGNVNADNSYDFLSKMQALLKASNNEGELNIFAPFVLFSKSMVALAAEYYKVVEELPYLSTSCFDSNTFVEDGTKVPQCGVCRSCTSLKQAFKFARITDPYLYEA